MKNLPPGWCWTTADQLTAPSPNSLTIGPFGSNLKVSDYTQSGIPLVFVRDIRRNVFGGPDTKYVSEEKARELSAHSVNPGDLLVTKMGDPPGDTTVYPNSRPPGIITADCIKLTANKRVTSSEFLAFSLRAPYVRKSLLEQTKGVAQQKLSLERFRQVPLPLPPLAEQYRIVSKFESVMARSRRAKEALDAIPALLERFRQSVLAAAFRGNLTADWRAQHPDVEPASKLLERIRAERRRRWEEAELEKMRAKGKAPKDESWKNQYDEPSSTEPLGDIPDKWCHASLNELRAIKPNSLTDGPFGSNLKTSDYVTKGIRVIRLGNLGVGKLDLSDEAFISSEKFNGLRKHELFAGDLVIAALAEPLARCCEIPASLGPAIVKADCIRFKPHPAVSSRLIMHYLNSPQGRSTAESLGHGIGRLRINMENLRQLPVPILPAEEQHLLMHRIEALLHRIEVLEKAYNSAQDKLVSMDEVVLAKAFRGEFVPQDPNDEPASVLLERIRAEREATAGSAPKRPRGRRPAA